MCSDQVSFPFTHYLIYIHYLLHILKYLTMQDFKHLCFHHTLFNYKHHLAKTCHNYYCKDEVAILLKIVVYAATNLYSLMEPYLNSKDLFMSCMHL